jgi:ribonuclease G
VKALDTPTEEPVRKQIIVNSTPNLVRVALLENGALAELHIQRASDEAAAGNIYKGRVLRVLPGMQAAFVDIGLEKAAFLHASDIVTDISASLDVAEDAEDIQYDDGKPVREHLPIEKKVKKGDELVVQMAKEAMGTKGARITSYISLPGKYVVFMPTGSQIGVSKRISDDRERRRLRDIVSSAKHDAGGIIVRTSCQGLPKKDIVDDVKSLAAVWENVLASASKKKAPALVHSDLDVVLRSVRDMLSDSVDEIVLDHKDDYDRTKRFVTDFMPDRAEHVKLFDDLEPVFDRYGVEEQVNRATDPKCWLKSGGYLVIDQGEALTMIDVNTGRFVGKKSQEETVLKTNLEAVDEIVSQLRMRNIGGIIILDLIDMEEPNNRRLVMQKLEHALSFDKARTSILRISELGLVEMTRKRTRENLERLISSPCPYCDGRGRIKSVETVGQEIMRKIQREAAKTRGADRRITVRANRDVIGYLYNDEEDAIRSLQDRVGRGILLKVAEKYHQEQYDVVAAG